MGLVYKYEHRYITDDDLEDADTAWMVEGLLAEQWFTLMCGLPGTSKSYLALHLALALAHGGSFLGRKILAPVRVNYVAMERSGEMRPRLRAYYREHAIEHAPLFSWTRDPLHLHRPESVEAYTTSLHPDTKLVVLDGLAHAMAGLDPMSDTDVGRITAGVEALKAKGCSVLALHHTPREKPRQERGSIMWRAYVDVLVSVTAHGDIRRYRIEKANTGDEGAEHDYALKSVGDRAVVVPWIDTDARILAAVPSDRGLTRAEVVSILAPSVSQATVYRRMKALADDGRLVKDGAEFRRAA